MKNPNLSRTLEHLFQENIEEDLALVSWIFHVYPNCLLNKEGKMNEALIQKIKEKFRRNIYFQPNILAPKYTLTQMYLKEKSWDFITQPESVNLDGFLKADISAYFLGINSALEEHFSALLGALMQNSQTPDRKSILLLIAQALEKIYISHRKGRDLELPEQEEIDNLKTSAICYLLQGNSIEDVRFVFSELMSIYSQKKTTGFMLLEIIYNDPHTANAVLMELKTAFEEYTGNTLTPEQPSFLDRLLYLASTGLSRKLTQENSDFQIRFHQDQERILVLETQLSALQNAGPSLSTGPRFFALPESAENPVEGPEAMKKRERPELEEEERDSNDASSSKMGKF